MRIALVGPLPPPSGGMANQTAQFARLLAEDGHEVRMIQTNPPYPSRIVGSLRGVRAAVRLAGFVRQLWRGISGAEVVHVMANSGWSWHLFAAPAVWVAHRLHVPVFVNYRGGEAREFFARSWKWVCPTIEKASAVVVPSTFLKEVFDQYGVCASIVPNVVDLSRFSPRPSGCPDERSRNPRFLVARNLEAIYDVGTAIQAFGRLRGKYPNATLTVAGSGVEEGRLRTEARSLGLEGAVVFTGRVDSADMPELYRSADIMLNTSLVDNTPNAILEAWASGVPVVTSDVGGIPHLVADGITGCLVAPRSAEAIASAADALLADSSRYEALRNAGLMKASEFAWSAIRGSWYSVYESSRRRGQTGRGIDRMEGRVRE